MINSNINVVKRGLGLFVMILLSACATFSPQLAPTNVVLDRDAEKELSHTFYLIGDAGKSSPTTNNPVLSAFKSHLKQADPANSTAIFLGDNIYPAGFPSKKHTQENAAAKHSLDGQINSVAEFTGNTFFIPGNHDWYAKGLKGLERQQKYLQKQLNNKNVFQPKDGCPIKKIKISDDVVLIVIDTEWFLIDWDQYPTINDHCSIRSREDFFDEIESLFKKNADKTTLVAMHHPMTTYGPHGGQYALKQHLYPTGGSVPLPVIGSLINVLRRTSGASIEDLNNKKYRSLRKRMYTLAQLSEKVIFVSGHEHSLQYIVEHNIPQIISGAGSKKSATKLLKGAQFTYGAMGFASLKIYKDGASEVRFYGLDEQGKEKIIFRSEVLPKDQFPEALSFNSEVDSIVSAAIYSKESIVKGGGHRFFWGQRYRDEYGVDVKVPTVKLDTLFGGLTPLRKGGGHQSKSLRLIDKNGKAYVMRALKKGAEQYLQAVAFKDQYVVGDFQGTSTEDLLQDFYTGSHPYAPFTIGTLADAITVYHTNPVLYYVPKQQALGNFNVEFGNELYMIEEHAGDDHDDQASFGYSKKLISTKDLYEKLRKDEDHVLDIDAYIKARLFDMIIGDWDRHTDQWRWATFKEKGSKKTIYKPVPRDRDQAFSVMGDGLLMGIATRIVPSLKSMEGFQENIRNLKGFNTASHAMDMILLAEATPEQWISQARYIQKNLSAEVIDAAFLHFPEEVRGKNTEIIKRKLLSRIAQIQDIAEDYNKILNKYSVVVGTDKDDWLSVERLSSGHTRVQLFTIKNGKKGKLYFDKTYLSKVTKEVWIYGLSDTDYFETKGVKKGRTKIRFIGGQNNDVYNFGGQNKIVVYDHLSKLNTFKSTEGTRVRLTNDYETNIYEPSKLKTSTNLIVPVLGYNPDDGLLLGISHTNTFNGFRRNPFTERHKFSASYFFATDGFNLAYEGEFAHVVEKWNLGFIAKFTSPFYTQNFFGYGNDTQNFEDELGVDFNRVRLESFIINPSLIYRGELGSKLAFGASYETVEVENVDDRVIPVVLEGNIDYRRTFAGVEMAYSYENKDNKVFTTMGMATSIKMGYKASIDDEPASFGYIIPSLSIDYRLVPSGKVVLATKFKGHFNLGNGYEFYQGATLGASDGLRSFRNQRFTGKAAYYQNTDIRYNLKKIRTDLLPISIGFFGGFDYGRVWHPDSSSRAWHTSYGLGFFVNGSELLGARFSLFTGEDGARFAFGLGFTF